MQCTVGKVELISDVLLWTPTHGLTSFGWSAKAYYDQFCKDTGCSLEDLPREMANWDRWPLKVNDDKIKVGDKVDWLKKCFHRFILQNTFFTNWTNLCIQLPNLKNEHRIWPGWLFGWLFWVLWHINLCRLFNALSIFIQIVSCISNNSV